MVFNRIIINNSPRMNNKIQNKLIIYCKMYRIIESAVYVLLFVLIYYSLINKKPESKEISLYRYKLYLLHILPLNYTLESSFAYPSMKDRVPVILSKLVDYLYREKKEITISYGEGSKEELKSVIGEISQLKNQLQTGKSLEKFSSSDPDTDLWNDHLEEISKKGGKLNFYEADWLFAECYLYRKIRDIFATKKCLRSVDPFCHQKTALLADSLRAICPLMDHMEKKGLTDASSQLSSVQKKDELYLFLKCALWANRLDLSLFEGISEFQTDLLYQVKHWDDNILVDSLPEIISVLIGFDNCSQVVDYITDNAGLELLCDFCLADFLVTRCNVKQVNFRVKPIPWYVSDVTPTDIHHTIQTFLSDTNPLYKKFGDRWKKFLDKGIWKVKTDLFWCLGFPYSDMVDRDNELYSELCHSSLIIFKGDLNYRKLLQDINWDPTTPFAVALGKFHPAPLVTLRTCKADLICGLKKDLADIMDAKYNDWLVSGNFAVVQFDSH